MRPLEALPLSSALLERYRIKSRQQHRPSLMGGHLMRRKGQSLEFREYVPYMPGDDIRHVDWRASARSGTGEDLLVRRFVAEEHLTLVISIDTRDTMALPERCSKIQLAMWLAEAIAWVTLRSDDRVVLHRLFGQDRNSLVELRGSGGLGRIRSTLRRFSPSYQNAENPVDPVNTANLSILRPYLPPTAVWVILTDFYFEQAHAQNLARQIASAQDGLRWVILVDLDSWPYEKAILGEGARRIDGPGLNIEQREFEITAENLKQVEHEIDAHKRDFLDRIPRTGYDLNLWKWPKEVDTTLSDERFQRFFKDRFLADSILQRLFMKEA